MKSVVTSLAALAIVGGAAAGMAAVAAPVEVQLAAVGAPLPQDPPPPPPPAPAGPGLPTPEQLANLCNEATDPGNRKEPGPNDRPSRRGGRFGTAKGSATLHG